VRCIIRIMSINSRKQHMLSMALGRRTFLPFWNQSTNISNEIWSNNI
jgi:hypothetical protein